MMKMLKYKHQGMRVVLCCFGCFAKVIFMKYFLIFILILLITSVTFVKESISLTDDEGVSLPDIEIINLSDYPFCSKKMDVVNAIVYYSDHYGLEKELMLAIAEAESKCGNVPNYKYDGENGRYTAFGIFQITRTTYRHYCDSDITGRMDNDRNIECAMKIASKSGVHHWNESKSKWQK